jgi:hypothetical protein
MDVTQLPSVPQFDLITAFDSIHDQVDPGTVLRRVSEALAPSGAFMMIDIKASSNLEENLEKPTAPLSFGVSVMHCMTISLAHGGAGLGNMWGEQVARSMLAEAGFREIEVVDTPPADHANCIYVCRK